MHARGQAAEHGESQRLATPLSSRQIRRYKNGSPYACASLVCIEERTIEFVVSLSCEKQSINCK
jgi:hypothetical protein